jgi:hypothetical protein
MRIEEVIAKLLRDELALWLPVLILTLRMLVNLFAHDIQGIFRRIFSLPEDMILTCPPKISPVEM